jgi:hypothetical protein
VPGLSSLPSVAGTKAALKAAAFSITPITPTGQKKLETRRFQYFPETLSDNKAVNWSNKEIPGASLPLYQWVAAGERTISFTAFFTSDVDLHATGNFFSGTGAGGLVNKRLVDEDRLSKAGVGHRNVDVKSALVWLRALMLPSYSTKNNQLGTPLTEPPLTLILEIPKSGIGLLGGFYSEMGYDAVMCIMTQCDITIEQFWPTGAPRVAQASLAFAQTAQHPVKNWVRFPSAGKMHTIWQKGDSKNFYGYTLKPDKGSGGG